MPTLPRSTAASILDSVRSLPTVVRSRTAGIKPASAKATAKAKAKATTIVKAPIYQHAASMPNMKPKAPPKPKKAVPVQPATHSDQPERTGEHVGGASRATPATTTPTAKRSGLNRYQTPLGTGTFGIVYLEGTHAIKRFKETSEGEIPYSVLRELNMVHILDHPNIVKLAGIQMRESLGELEMIMPNEGMNLRKFAAGNPYVIRLERLKSFMSQLTSAIRYLHTVYCIHRDLKPDNVLVRRDGHITLCDLGLCKVLTVGAESFNTQQVCTLNYKAPELFPPPGQSGTNYYTQAIDLWSLGALMHEFLLNSILFKGRSDFHVISSILTQVPTTPEELEMVGLNFINPAQCNQQAFYRLPPLYDDTLRDTRKQQDLQNYRKLIESLLRLDPAKRLTADQAREHAYFTDTPDATWNQNFYMRMTGRYDPAEHYLTVAERNTFLDYIFTKCGERQLSQQTCLLAVSVFDRYVCQARPSRGARGIAISNACKVILYIVSKYVDIECLGIDVLTASGQVTEAQLVQLEREVLKEMQYRIHYATLLDLFRNIRGSAVSPTLDEWNTMRDIVYDYRLLRGKTTQELMALLESRLDATKK
jgi:hypothetical protein